MYSISKTAVFVGKAEFWLKLCIYLAVLGWSVSHLFSLRSATTARPEWVQTPCVIKSSELLDLAGESSNSTVRVRVVYRYAFNGRDHEFSRQHLLTVSPADGEGIDAVLRRFPRGQETNCYVNRRHPAEAVLERPPAAPFFPSVIFDDLFWVLDRLPLILVVGSVIGLVVLLRRGWNPSGKSPTRPAQAHRDQGVAFSGRRLRADTTSAGSFRSLPRMRHLGRLLGIGFVALLWNGGMASFVVLMFKTSEAGDGMNWSVSIFQIPFVLVGLWLIYLFGRSLLALFNPRPRLRFNRHALAPGHTLELEWRVRWRVQKLSRLKFVLEGREEATCGRGTQIYEDVSVFAQWPIAEITQREEMRSGRASLSIPLLTVPTLEMPNNRIVWAIRIQGEIPSWPDLDESMPLTLQPAQPSQPPLPTSASS